MDNNQNDGDILEQKHSKAPNFNGADLSGEDVCTIANDMAQDREQSDHNLPNQSAAATMVAKTLGTIGPIMLQDDQHNVHQGYDQDDGLALALLKAVRADLYGDGTMVFTNPVSLMQLLQCQSHEVPRTQQQWTGFMAPPAQRLRRQALARLTWDGAQYALRYEITTLSGQKLWIEEIGQRLSGDNRRAGHILTIFRNISAEQDRYQRAQYLSAHDPHTELPNQKNFVKNLTLIMAAQDARRSDIAPSCGIFLRIRLINIADINTVYGYDAGDHLIKKIGARLQQNFTLPNLVARLDGADFGLYLAHKQRDDLETIRQDLKMLLGDMSYATPFGPLFAQCQIGGVWLDNAAKTHNDDAPHSKDMPRSEDILRQSAVALDNKTEQGEINSDPWQIKILPDTPSNITVQRASAAITKGDILRALNSRKISLAYQPIIEARSGDLHHYECLLRLTRADGAIVSAGAFIMAAEQLGLVYLLDHRALELASKALRADPDLRLALNLSAATLYHDSAAQEYLTALKALGPIANRITIELTETAALDDPQMASHFSAQLQALGCDFAIDDFGSGYTTFRNLMAIEAATIKIDGSLIMDIASDHHKQSFMRMMVDLAQTFAVKIVAEMVDSPADAEILRRIGVDYLQGYMFGVPSAIPNWQRITA